MVTQSSSLNLTATSSNVTGPVIKLVALDKENSYLVTPSASYWKQRALWWGAYVMRFSIWCTSPFYTDIFCSEATVARRRKALGLLGSKSATHNALNLVKRQLVLDQLAKDPSGQTGPRLICEDIVFWYWYSSYPVSRNVQTTFLYLLGFHYFWKRFYHTRNVGLRGVCNSRTDSK